MMAKNISMNNGWNSSKFDENYKPTDSVNAKHKESEENYTKAPCDKILKAVQRKKDILYRRTKVRMTPYFLSKSMQTRKQCSDIRTETVNLEFSTQWKYLLKKRWN